MEFHRFKHKYYDNHSDKWRTIRSCYIRIDHGDRSAIHSLTFPEPVYDKTWTIIPTITYQHDVAILPGPSFTLQFKWLKWSISFQVSQYLKSTLDEELAEETEEETADNNEQSDN